MSTDEGNEAALDFYDLKAAIAATDKDIWSQALDSKEAGDDGEAHKSESEAEGGDAEAGHEDKGEVEAESGDGEQARGKDGKFAAKDEGDKKPGAKAENDTVKPEKPDPKAAQRVPLKRLDEESEKRKTAEAERDTAVKESQTARDEVKTLNAKLDGILAALKQPQAQVQPAKQEAKPEDDKTPDMFADPEGYARWVEQRAERRVAAVESKFEQQFVTSSMEDAHEKHGKAFEDAWSNLMTLDDSAKRQIVPGIWSSPNPGKALVNWHNQQRTSREIGNDLDAYNKRIEAAALEKLKADPEFRKSLLAEMRGEAEGALETDQTRTVIRKPLRSLNGAGGGANSDDRSFASLTNEAAIWDHVIRS